MNVLQLTPDVTVHMIGPPLEKGRLPSVFYFGISAQESLELDPYNQPAKYLTKHSIRVFSMDLPYHGPNLNSLDAIQAWADAFERGEDPLKPFLEKVSFALDELISRGLILKEKIGLLGLSRGGFLASLFAAKYTPIRATVGFAPMTMLTFAKEFHKLTQNKVVLSYNLENHLEALCSQTLRFYIGNRDVLVGTGNCFQLMEKLVETSFKKGDRSAPIELMISASIGHKGHGTAKEIFEAGAHWLGTKLGAIR